MRWRSRALQLLPAGLVAMMMLGAGAASAHACTKTWTGNAADGAWTTPGNWTGNSIPGASDTVCIPASTPTVTLSGSATIASLSDAGSLTIAASSSLTVTTTVDDTGGSITLHGTDNLLGSDPATLDAATITNGGTLDLDHVGLGSQGASTVAASSTLTNTGTVEIGGSTGPFSITGAITNAGTFTIGSGLSLALPPTTSLTNAAGKIDVEGTLALNGPYTQGNGTVTTNPITLDDGSSVDFTGDGASSVSVGGGSTVGVSGTIAPTQTLTAQGVDACIGSNPATLNATGVLVNKGTLDLDHSGTCTGGAVTLNAPAGLTNTGVTEISGTRGTHSITGAMFNRGDLVIDAGVQLDATLTQTAGITAIGQAATLSQSTGSVELVGGELTGPGTIAGSLDNYAGLVAVGPGPVTTSVTGEYTQGPNGSLAIYAGGAGSGQHSVLDAGAGVVLGGQVTIVPSPAYAASAEVNDRIPFLVFAGQRSGQFQSIDSSPALAAGLSFVASYDDTDGTVVAVVQPAPPAIALTRPVAGARYQLHQTVHARYRCTEPSGGPGVESCIGSTADRAPISTATPGSKAFTVTATSVDGLSSTKTVDYTVAPPTNHVKLVRVRVQHNGTARLQVKLPGPGRLVITEKLRGRRALLLFRVLINIRSAGTLGFGTGPVGRARRELARIRGRKPHVVLTIAYQPTGGRARTLTLRRSL